MTITENISLKQYNTFGIEARASYFAEVSTTEEVKQIFDDSLTKELPKLILGGGSNILFTKDFEGIVIKIISNSINIIDEDNNNIFIKADAGTEWHNLVRYCVKKNYGGIENLSLIPGSVGASPIQNIGAYGQELKDSFYSLDGIFTETLQEKTFYKDECKFGYRESIFKKELKGKFIITSVTLKLNLHPTINTSYGTIEQELTKLAKNNYTISDVSEVICKIRESKLPKPEDFGNAGSFFKNPEVYKTFFEDLKLDYPDLPFYPLNDKKVKIPAAWLIENAGLKGMRTGTVGVHDRQALVIINYGGANGSDIINLKNYIKKIINKKYCIDLEEEVNIV
ncbi:MAG: UDP-N-acetylmuramate dehydrogenase [Ignavibacteria bacterium]|nr:UDP-N-acetylmuramate dehydrogenase [Ignavibacteria bacterium]